MPRPGSYSTKVEIVGRPVADVTTITAGANHADVTHFCGFSVREAATIAAATRVNFRRGTSSGQLLATVELAADGHSTQAFPFEFSTPDGVYVEVPLGTIAGVLFNRGS